MERLRDFPWRNFGVEFAVLFGSRARGRPVKGDWDFAVWPDVGENYGELLHELAKFLGVKEWDIDLVFIDEDMPCALAVEIFRGCPSTLRLWVNT
ncbi:MAG: nucleotidyltransferase family protein [Thermoproteus sp. AZ2]|uniref:Nucleotidyltransferase family protein n=1 Tax=Thermoproteus sp. AZ2 TaxID=1609232 RepID=A0ACC6UYB6_9CREN